MAARWRASSCSESSAEEVVSGMERWADRSRVPALDPSLLFVLALDDALEARELLALAEIDERDALRRATHLADRLHPRADQHAAGRNQHDFVVRMHQRCGDDGAVARGLLDCNHALRAPAVPRVFD